MRTLIRFSVAVVVFVALSGLGATPPPAQYAAAEEYGPDAIEWKVMPDAEAELTKMRATDHYRSHREHTRMFVRTQLKYGLEREDYLHKWYDRPLMGDVRYQAADERGHMINPESWKRMAELGRICGHGFSAFTVCGERYDFLNRSVMPGYEAEVLVETVMCAPEEPRFELALKRVEEALAAPNAFRIDGKLILTSYPAIRIDKLDVYRRMKTELVKRWGDRVALMPYFSPFPMNGRPFDRQELNIVRNNLREALRAVDGLCFSTETVLYHNRRTNPCFAVEVAAPLIHSVLSEPEFKDKFFGMTVSCGHENCYRWNYAKDCTGTRRLRDNYAAVLAMRPDFINATEWDEENENTHHRPTISQGFVFQRLLRHAAAVFDGREQTVYPGDDPTLPNLSLSYRKALLAGEPIEVEVLNIPDGSLRGQEFTVGFRWRNAAGKVVKEFPPCRLKADELKAAWFVAEATELIAEPLLRPELTVWYDGRERVLSDGFWPLSLHVNRSIEFRWVKQSIREKTPGTVSSLTFGEPAADGTIEVRGSVESPEELRSVEVLDGPDTVYLFDPTSPHRDADGSLAVKVSWQGMPWNTAAVDGAIRLVGGGKTVFNCREKPRNAVIGKKEIKFRRAVLRGWTGSAFADIPAEEIDDVEFEVELPPYFQGRVKARDLIAKDIVSFPSEHGMNLVFRRWLAARELTPPCGGKKAVFSFRMKPTSPDSVLRLQTVDAKFHVDYGAACVVRKPSGRSACFTAFERDRETVTRASVDSSRLVECDYRFEPGRGGVVTSGAGLGLDGILCGYTPLVAGYGSAESANGNVVLECGVNAKAPGWPKTAPEYFREQDGTWSLKFGNASFVTLPQQVVPAYAGFELEMEVNPEEVERCQGLLTTGPTYFSLYIIRGRVYAKFFLRNNFFKDETRAEQAVRGPKIKPDRWSRIRVVWDRRVCRIDVDGVKGEPVKLLGDLFYARHTALGVLMGNDSFFHGRIRRVRTRIGNLGE